MLLQKMVLAPRLAPVLAAACEVEYQILLLIEPHPDAKKQAAEYRSRVAAKGNHPQLSKLLSILMSTCGLRDPNEASFLRSCVKLRNLLIHGAYRSAVQAVADLPQLTIKNNIVSFGPPRGFQVPEFETRLEEVMMFVNEDRWGPLIVQIFDGAHILLALRVNGYYERKHRLPRPMMTVGDYPG